MRIFIRIIKGEKMEQKTKYQYTNFIYPYSIPEDTYKTYLQNLLGNKKVELTFWEKERDYHLYSYFLPVVRDYLFWSLEWDHAKEREFLELDNKMKALLLSQKPCTIFEYKMGEDIQGKVGQANGIFFKIQKIQIICFSTGICFLTFKTNIENSNLFSDVLNFNYKFRDIHSEFASLKEYENIKIQTDALQDMKELGTLIEEIAGKDTDMKSLNIDTDRFLTYAYSCIEPENWNEQNSFEQIQYEFLKYCNVLPANYKSDFNTENIYKNFNILDRWKFMRCGFTKTGTGLLASGIDTTNYTKLPFSYENEYFYTYIFTLYKKIYLKKLNKELRKKINTKKSRKKFIDFTQNIWIQEITNDTLGIQMEEEWKKVLDLNNLYSEVKNKYDVLYRENNIEKNTVLHKVVATLLSITVLIHLVTVMILFLKR